MQMNQILNNLIEYDRMMKLTLGWNKQQTNRSPIKTIINNRQQFIIYQISATNIPDQKDLAVYASEWLEWLLLNYKRSMMMKRSEHLS